MAPGESPPPNPYVGPRPFEAGESERFFGRESETEILTGLVLSRQAVLLFAPSGAGKSSLIRAGLTPALHKEEMSGWGEDAQLAPRMRVLPIASARGTLPPRLTKWPDNPFVFGVLHSLFPAEEPDSLVDLRLEAGLSRIVDSGAAREEAAAAAGGMIVPPVLVPSLLVPSLLVIDQFEEIFTHHRERVEERADFFRQMARALHKLPDLHVLLAIREDYIAELTPFAAVLPDGLRARLRLDRLGAQAAQAAVRGPAAAAGIELRADAADRLVKNLRRVPRKRMELRGETRRKAATKTRAGCTSSTWSRCTSRSCAAGSTSRW